MSLRQPLVRQGLPPPIKLQFDFFVTERPRYIPGSGPPLAPVTIMPPNDKDGYIIDQVMLYSELRYIVGYRETPTLRVAVKLPNILKWVSQRTLEEWHKNKYDSEVREEEERELPLLEAKDEKRRKKMEKLEKLRGIGLPAETKSRKRKRAPFYERPVKVKKAINPVLGVNKSPGRPRGPGSRNQPVEEEVTFKSPKQSQHSQQQPSLSAPGGGLANRTVLDTDSEDDDTELALEYQLKGDRIPRSNVESSRSNSPPTNSKRNTRSRSGSKHANTSREESRSPSVSTVQTIQRQRSHNQPSVSTSKGAVASISSREALQVYEDLERKNGKRPQSLIEKYSHTKNKPKPDTFKGAHSRLPPPSRGLAQLDTEDEGIDEPEEENKTAEEETEYEVRQILDHELRYKPDGTPDTWYLIQWVGDWDNTMEPEENVGRGAIDEYEAKQRKKRKRFRGTASGDGDDSDPDSLFVSDGKGKGKKVQPGQLIDEGENEDDDDDDDNNEGRWQAFGVASGSG
jgi:hypothetical protein